MSQVKTPPAYGESAGPRIVACQENMSLPFPAGPAEQDAGGSRVRSASSLLMRFNADCGQQGRWRQRAHVVDKGCPRELSGWLISALAARCDPATRTMGGQATLRPCFPESVSLTEPASHSEGENFTSASLPVSLAPACTTHARPAPTPSFHPRTSRNSKQCTWVGSACLAPGGWCPPPGAGLPGGLPCVPT